MEKTSEDTPSSYTESSPQTAFTIPIQEGGYEHHPASPYSTSQPSILSACSWPYQNWHSQPQSSLTQHIDVRAHGNSRCVDDIVIRSRVKSSPLPGASYSLHNKLQRCRLPNKILLHSHPTSVSASPPCFSGNDLVSEEHAIMSPNPATCNPVMSSRIPTILGPLEMLTRILIPNSKIGAVIGKGGSIIKKIRESSGAKITICGSCAGAPGVGENNTADDSGDRMVTIAGLYLAVLSAFQAIVSQTEPGFGKRGTDEPTRGGGGHSNSGSICVRLLVPNSRAGGLIGRGGSTIRVIREQSCARIEISSHGLYIAGGGLLDRIVAITGTFSACIRAYQMICLQLANIPNLGTLATSLTSQDYVVPGNSGTVHGGGMANTPISQIHEQTWLGHQQQRVGCGVGVYHGNMALQPVPQVGSPFHVPPGSSPRALQSELPKLSSPSGYVPPTILSNIAPDQGRGGHRSDTSPTSSLGCLPHSLNGNGRRRSSSTPDNYYSSSHPSFISDFTADVIRNVGLKDNRNTFNASTAASVPINRDASPAPIKITVDMDIPYEALTAMRLDHGFSNIMNISGAVLEELQTTPVSTWSGLHSNVDVKGGDAIERVEELDVEEFNSQECDSGRKDKCKDEGDQSSDPLDQQEGSLPSEWRHDTCTENSSLCSNVSFTNCISTKSMGDSSSSKSSLSSLKDNATLNGKCTSSSNRISITGTLEEIELAQLLVTSRLTQKKDDTLDASFTCGSEPISVLRT